MTGVTWHRSDDCVGSQVEDSLILLDLEGGMYFALNGPATDVWEALAEPRTEDDLVAILVGKYKVTTEDCTRSVQRLLADLSEKGLAKSSA